LLFLSGADAQCNRIVRIVIGLALARDSDGREKFVRAGSFRLGDALDRYGESRRRAIVQLSPPRVVGQGGPWMARRSVRLEKRYGRNRCKVDDDSIRLQGMPSRTLVTHRIARAIQPRTRARSSADSRPASGNDCEKMCDATDTPGTLVGTTVGLRSQSVAKWDSDSAERPKTW
jgi:hypothetical protein